jgi:hypothetical protein
VAARTMTVALVAVAATEGRDRRVQVAVQATAARRMMAQARADQAGAAAHLGKVMVRGQPRASRQVGVRRVVVVGDLRGKLDRRVRRAKGLARVPRGLGRRRALRMQAHRVRGMARQRLVRAVPMGKVQLLAQGVSMPVGRAKVGVGRVPLAMHRSRRRVRAGRLATVLHRGTRLGKTQQRKVVRVRVGRKAMPEMPIVQGNRRQLVLGVSRRGRAATVMVLVLVVSKLVKATARCRRVDHLKRAVRCQALRPMRRLELIRSPHPEKAMPKTPTLPHLLRPQFRGRTMPVR